MSDDAGKPTVQHNEAAHRFETRVHGHLAVAEYVRDGNTITFTHTDVPKAIEGRGVASELARTALDYARAEHLTVEPACSFFATYLWRHLEFTDLLLNG